MPSLSAIPSKLFRLLKRARFRWRMEREFLHVEWKQSRNNKLPWTYRVRCWWTGFHTFRAPLYRLDDPALAPLYVRDRDIYRNGGLDVPFTYPLDDKHAFWSLLQTQTDHVAPLAGLIHRGRFFPSQGAGAAGPLADVLHAWRGAFFIKPSRGSAGVGLNYIVCSDAGILVNGQPTTAQAFTDRLGNKPYVVSPAITQAAYASAVQPATNNTIRLLTVFNETEGRAHVIAATHNFGRSGGDTPIDHWYRGGVACPVNLQTGELAAGTVVPNGLTVQMFDTHPETGAQLRGLVIPRWAQVRAEVERVATALGYIPYVGWDVLMTDDSFRILEGNARSALGLLQIQGPLLANPHFRALLQSRGKLPKRLRSL